MRRPARLPVVRRIRFALLAAAMAFATAACAESSDGVRRSICGTWIGSPADGIDRSPWYLDVTGGPPPAAVKLYLDPEHPEITLSIVNLRVSDDCAHGATTTLSGARLLDVGNEVHADDRRTIVALIQPRHVGRTTLVVGRPGQPSIRVPFVIRRANSLSA